MINEIKLTIGGNKPDNKVGVFLQKIWQKTLGFQKIINIDVVRENNSTNSSNKYQWHLIQKQPTLNYFKQFLTEENIIKIKGNDNLELFIIENSTKKLIKEKEFKELFTSKSQESEILELKCKIYHNKIKVPVFYFDNCEKTEINKNNAEFNFSVEIDKSHIDDNQLYKNIKSKLIKKQIHNNLEFMIYPGSILINSGTKTTLEDLKDIKNSKLMSEIFLSNDNQDNNCKEIYLINSKCKKFTVCLYKDVENLKIEEAIITINTEDFKNINHFENYFIKFFKEHNHPINRDEDFFSFEKSDNTIIACGYFHDFTSKFKTILEYIEKNISIDNCDDYYFHARRSKPEPRYF